MTEEDPSRNSGFGHKLITVFDNLREDLNTVELHLFGLIGTASHPDIQKIRSIGFSLKIRYIGSTYLRLNPSTTPDLKF